MASGQTSALTRSRAAVNPSAGPTRRAPRLPHRQSLQRRRSIAGLLMTLPAMLAVLCFFVVPLILMVWMAFNDWGPFGTPRFIGVANFTRAFHDARFWTAGLFTLVYTVIITPILFVLGLGLALLVRRRRPGVGFFRTAFFVPVVIGLAASSYLWVWLVQPGLGPLWDLLRRAGLISANTNLLATTGGAVSVVIVMVVWKSVGLQMILQMAGLQSIPDEIEEAARIDGASRWQIILHIFVPLLRPTFALLLVFGVGGSLLAFDQFYIMTGGGPSQSTTTAVFTIYRSSFVSFQFGYGSAISIILLVVLAGVSAFQMFVLRRSAEDEN